jgi:hypothetical protein
MKTSLQQNPTLAIAAALLLSLPLWAALVVQVYLQGILFMGWPMKIGSIEVFMYCNPHTTTCVMAVPDGALAPLDWIVSPLRGGVPYIVALSLAVLMSFRSTIAGSWQRSFLWALLACPIAVVAVLTYMATVV